MLPWGVAARDTRDEDFVAVRTTGAVRADCCVARTMLAAARDFVVVLLRWVVVRAPVWTALREVVVRWGDVAVRADTLRLWFSVARDVTDFAEFPRWAVVRDGTAVALRAGEFVVRTAALAPPMQTKQAIRSDSVLFIPYLYNKDDTKKHNSGQVIFIIKLIKNPAVLWREIFMRPVGRGWGGCVQQTLCVPCPGHMVSFQHEHVRQC